MSEKDVILIAYFESESEATLAKALLEENQIRVVLTGLEPSALGFSLEGDDGIGCYVGADDVERARQLLSDLMAADEEDETVEIPAWICPQCQEEVDEGFAVCWNCNAEFPINSSP